MILSSNLRNRKIRLSWIIKVILAFVFGVFIVPVYLLAAGTPWIQVASSPVARVEGATVLINGKIYVFSGFYNSDLKSTTRVDVYDPSSNTWTRATDIPLAVTHLNPIFDGKYVWLAGGFLGDHPGPATANVFKFDVAANTWSQGPSLPEARAGGALVLHQRNAHYFGGFKDRNTNSSDHWVLNVDTGVTWTTATPLPDGRGHLAGALVNNKIYAIGGQHGHDKKPVDLKRVDVYDPQTNTWTEVANLPLGRSHFEPGTFVRNGEIVIVGGRSNVTNKNALQQITKYDPVKNVWQELDPLPVALLAPVAQSVGNRLYVTHGGLNETESPQSITRYRAFLEGETYQAEAGLIVGAKVMTNHTGYTGSGFVDFQNISGDNITWNVTPATAGLHSLAFRYTNGGTENRSVKLLLNGNIVNASLVFPKTAAWTNWKTVMVDVSLNNGMNEIKIETSGTNGPNVDSLVVTTF